jgi:hypothetical protein
MLKQVFALLAAVTLFTVPATAEVEYQVSPDGIVMEVTIEDADFEAFLKSVPEGVRATFCMNSTSTFGINWFWELQGNRVPGGVDVTGGFIFGTICDSPNWDVTGGFISGTTLQLNGVYVGSASCADEVDMSGTRTVPGPRVWSGEYGFPIHSFPHDTALLFPIGPCP